MIEKEAKMFRIIAGKLIRPFLVLLAAGGFIGLLHREDAWVAFILTVAGAVVLWRMSRHRPLACNVVFVAGLVLTGAFGVRAELWGIAHGYWSYHDLHLGRQFPLWLPMAWMLAFVFLYRVERRFIESLRLTALRHKLLLAAVVSVVLPTWGEIVTINMGVWTYTWGMQFFGVPLLAIFLLMVLHMGVYLVCTLICRIAAVDDVVFGYRPLR